MGLRFQRRIGVFPGLRVNLSKSGVGFSVGARGQVPGGSGSGGSLQREHGFQDHGADAARELMQWRKTF
jgi:hypothetical protein